MALRANSHRAMDTLGRDMMKYMMKMWASNAVYWRHFPMLTAKEDEEEEGGREDHCQLEYCS
jgi:hypothetical protein